ncbi:MAG: CBS domain-containing protein [Gammaproteobacteria bacterium]|jgi:Mg/Co/Ni transporter MgtE|nr:CBS domain-containing protein [Gammaproteobacteria bacterium]
MLNSSRLTLAFINRYPDASAKVIASIASEDAAEFMESIPTRYAVAAFQALNTSASASIIKHMDETSATAVIRAMEFATAAAILRQLSSSKRTILLQDIPSRTKRSFEKSMAFATDVVGAVMTTDIPLLFANDEVKQGLNLLKKHTEKSIDSIFVVDDKRRFLGVVHVLDMLRHTPTTRLESLVDSSCTGVSANARLEQIADLEAWQLHRQLPVISRRGEVIGAIERKTFCQICTTNTSATDTDTASTAQLVLGAMADCSHGLMTLLVNSPSQSEPRGESNGS